MWLEEYSRLMFKTINNDIETMKAIKIKNKNMPDIIYKYRTVSTNSINALEKGFLMAVSPRTLNDPNEGRLFIDFHDRWKLLYQSFLDTFFKITGFRLAVDINQFEKREDLLFQIMESMSIPKEDTDIWNKMWGHFEKILEDRLINYQNELIEINEELYRICSFSECCDSILMWTHYADESKGFCVGYNLKELNNDLTELLLPVRYNDSLIEVDDTFFGGKEPNKSLHINSLTLKSTDWNYEKEWRLLLLAENNEKMQKVQLPTPKEIILGLNISRENQDKLLDIATTYNIPCYKTVKDSSSFRYKFEQMG
jgi:uncharacterized protein YbgA (DUF1722 family)